MSEMNKRVLASWYWQAMKQPNLVASKEFIRTQADYGTWPALQKLCALEMQKREGAMYALLASTSFSDGMAS